MKQKLAVTAGAVAVFALVAAGCSSSDESESETTTTTSATTSAAAFPPAPTPDQLNADLALAFDETVPIEQKLKLVQGADQDPELINKVAAAAKANNTVIDVVDVTDHGDGTATANITIAVGANPPNPGSVDFVYEDGTWKMSKTNACGFVQLAQLASPACP